MEKRGKKKRERNREGTETKASGDQRCDQMLFCVIPSERRTKRAVDRPVIV